ncbi:hypothetical protein ACO2D6_005498, partial [Escherichia coli]
FCSLLAPSDAILFQEGVSVKLRLPHYVGYCTCCPIIIQSAEAKLNPEAVRHGMSDPRKRIQEVRMRQYLHIERGQLTA